MKKYIWAIAACIMVAGVITFVACNKDSESNQITNPSFPSAKGYSTQNQLRNVMVAYYAACDSAYQADSTTFLSVCANNDTTNFLKVTGISSEMMAAYHALALQELEDFVNDNPNFKPDENPCASCSYNALPRLGTLASATSGHMAALVPFKIGENDRQRLANCISWCEMMTTPCGMTACVSACMGEYYDEIFLPFTLKFKTYSNIYTISGRNVGCSFACETREKGSNNIIKFDFTYIDENYSGLTRISEDCVRIDFTSFSHSNIIFTMSNIKQYYDSVCFDLMINDSLANRFTLMGSHDFVSRFIEDIFAIGGTKEANPKVNPIGVVRVLGYFYMASISQDMVNLSAPMDLKDYNCYLDLDMARRSCEVNGGKPYVMHGNNHEICTYRCE